MKRSMSIGTENQIMEANGEANTKATCSVTSSCMRVLGRSESNILASIPETNRLITIKRQNKSDPAFDMCRSNKRLSIAVRTTNSTPNIPT